MVGGMVGDVSMVEVCALLRFGDPAGASLKKHRALLTLAGAVLCATWDVPLNVCGEEYTGDLRSDR